MPDDEDDERPDPFCLREGCAACTDPECSHPCHTEDSIEGPKTPTPDAPGEERPP